MNTLHKNIKTLLIALIIFFPICLLAQNPGDIPAEPLDVPFDGGASILIASGLAYGVKKYRDMKKDEKEEEKKG